MSLTQLNTALITEYESNTGSYATALRAEVSAIYLDSAPPGEPYPIIVFENLQSSTEFTWCTDITLVPIDFISYADTKDKSLELAYNLKKLYDNNTLTLSGGYTNVAVDYTGQFSDYDTTDNKFFVRTSFNYSITNPSENYAESSGESRLEYIFEFQEPEEYEVKSSSLVSNAVTIDKAVAKASVAGVGASVFNVYQNDTIIGTITFDAGSTTGTVAITDTTFAAGDYIGVFCETPDAALDGVDITISGII